MKNNIRIIFSFFLTVFYFNTAFSEPLECPPPSAVKNVLLIKAQQYFLDPDCWNFASQEFTYKGIHWNVWFGSFFKGVSNPTVALKEGQTLFNQSSIQIKNPEPYETAKKITVCNYVPEGEIYWISAVSPPTFDHIP